MSDKPDDTAEAAAKPPKRSMGKRLLRLALRLIVPVGAFLGGGAGAIYAISSGLVEPPDPKADEHLPKLAMDDDGDGEKPVISYYRMKDSFTSNLKDSSRLVQITISLSTRYDGKVFEAVEKHEDAIRARLLALLLELTPVDVTSEAAKRQLRLRMRDAVNDELKRRAGFDGVEEAFITSLIIQ
jgi:flagellar FliL protein